jgi:hypothetical protein
VIALDTVHLDDFHNFRNHPLRDRRQTIASRPDRQSSMHAVTPVSTCRAELRAPHRTAFRREASSEVGGLGRVPLVDVADDVGGSERGTSRPKLAPTVGSLCPL